MEFEHWESRMNMQRAIDQIDPALRMDNQSPDNSIPQRVRSTSLEPERVSPRVKSRISRGRSHTFSIRSPSFSPRPILPQAFETLYPEWVAQREPRNINLLLIAAATEEEKDLIKKNGNLGIMAVAARIQKESDEAEEALDIVMKKNPKKWSEKWPQAQIRYGRQGAELEEAEGIYEREGGIPNSTKEGRKELLAAAMPKKKKQKAATNSPQSTNAGVMGPPPRRSTRRASA